MYSQKFTQIILHFVLKLSVVLTEEDWECVWHLSLTVSRTWPIIFIIQPKRK